MTTSRFVPLDQGLSKRTWRLLRAVFRNSLTKCVADVSDAAVRIDITSKLKPGDRATIWLTRTTEARNRFEGIELVVAGGTNTGERVLGLLVKNGEAEHVPTLADLLLAGAKEIATYWMTAIIPTILVLGTMFLAIAFAVEGTPALKAVVHLGYLIAFTTLLGIVIRTALPRALMYRVSAHSP